MTPVTILLADDHALVRQGIRRILESRPDFQVVAEAGSGLEAVPFSLEHKPQLAILDIGMKELNGLEALAQIRRGDRDIRVVILSMHRDERYVRQAIKLGAAGYLLKDCVEDELVEAISAVRRGQTFFSSGVKPIIDQMKAPWYPTQNPDDLVDLLTSRERLIYQLLAEGNANKDVAALLGLSLHTVETHRARIMSKLRLHSAAELVLSAVRRGLVC